MTVSTQRFASDSELVDYFNRKLRLQLETAIAERGHAYLVVSGGRTPIPLFQRLATQQLAWPQVTIVLADERWLPASDAASNERLVREHLLQDQAAAANFVSLLTSAEDPYQAAAVVSDRLAALPTFDAVILGMGEDGHTASLFPGSDELQEGLTTDAAALAVTPKHAPHARMSMSKKRLLDSRQIYFHLSGAAKAAVLDHALAEEDVETMPVRAFLHQQQVPVEVLLASS
ncbi:6-phosphogluconolactonase [Pseudidiomarina sp. 1APP75-32.1]|uniref:6-phosphogluconolactonase n=1 Tax=Pseudidiomarina terrestris TaxID=2820060 RepID=A0AAW7R0L1_9GAMM|nr:MULTISPECIES: 6-phosphogluconolactonase [unclassified Pseudidiomarina]MDN7124165.1 6-phosphogluconolactonase [Pseudidiomarina sp. 1APP75-32.1]MDN7127232.1 6-phosphogluconolactonase [Pseudidiomarina sp. 1APR75-33.1]MDN7128422.1 6-phosphogluconolactonase [Pseudidiomarina sp. 1APR75-15]MDN7138612.1 6-phosphogluconolactonase [Pseudidiomarina sp. 1ASP75-14]MEA3586901.1 6-phosphogluconolactonase [Pseudidiomarina sp. 1APP75-27a]